MTTTSTGIDPVRLRLSVNEALSGWRVLAMPGTLRLLFVAPPAEVRTGWDLPEPADDFDDLYLRDILTQVERVGTPAVVVAVARPQGRPLRRDRVLCRQLEGRMRDSSVSLADIVTVGETHAWSMLSRRRLPPPALPG